MIRSALLAPGIVLAGCLSSGAYEPPRTEHGRPDLQGIWSNASVTGMTRPSGYPLVLTPERAAELEGQALYNRRVATESEGIDPDEGAPEAGAPLPAVGNYSYVWTDPGSKIAVVKGELRSSWIVDPEDGQIPYSEHGRALRDADQSRSVRGADHPEQRSLGERCILGIAGSGGPPLGVSLYNNNVQIVQTEDDVMILAEMIHDVRIVRLASEHPDDGAQPYMGDSIGWWEGDTLVVETVDVHPAQRRDGRVLLSGEGKITERFSRVNDRQILYEFEVDDPAVYAQVWRGETSLNLIDEPIYEYACHEGNYGLAGILAGGRSADRAAAAAD